jgi:hypothetical protein
MYIFNSQDDITIMELADCLTLMHVYGPQIEDEVYNKLYKELKRHFRPVNN